MNVIPLFAQISAKYGILGEEPVAGVNRVGSGLQRRADHVRDVEVALAGVGWADVNRLVGERTTADSASAVE